MNEDKNFGDTKIKGIKTSKEWTNCGQLWQEKIQGFKQQHV